MSEWVGWRGMINRTLEDPNSPALTPKLLSIRNIATVLVETNIIIRYLRIVMGKRFVK
jgi:hypothetical protein